MYLDGYADQGSANNPQFCGEFEAMSIKDAVEQFALNADPEYVKHIDWDRLSLYGCRFRYSTRYNLRFYRQDMARITSV